MMFINLKTIIPFFVIMLCIGCSNVNPKDNNGKTMFISYIENGNIYQTKQLIEKGVDVNEKDPNGVTPIMVAAAEGQPEIVKMLIDKGAKLDDVDNEGFGALEYAKRKMYNEEVIEIIIKNRKY